MTMIARETKEEEFYPEVYHWMAGALAVIHIGYRLDFWSDLVGAGFFHGCHFDYNKTQATKISLNCYIEICCHPTITL